MPAWIPYTLLRIVLFGGVFALLMLLGLDYFWAALVAAVVGLTVSYIFFPSLRNQVSIDFGTRRDAKRATPRDPAAPTDTDNERGVDEFAEDAIDESGRTDADRPAS